MMHQNARAFECSSAIRWKNIFTLEVSPLIGAIIFFFGWLKIIFCSSIQAPCPDPTVPMNGRVLELRPGNRHGERVKFACDPGFKMEGPSTVTCNNGKWNLSTPLCKGMKVNQRRLLTSEK